VPVAERKLTFQNLLLFTTDDTLLSDSPSHLAQLQDPEAVRILLIVVDTPL
jgi:hypothetical protein